jgi:hypothetical protein
MSSLATPESDRMTSPWDPTPCIDCGTTDAWYLVGMDIAATTWDHVSPPVDCICFDCIEVRLGRGLVAEDFPASWATSSSFVRDYDRHDYIPAGNPLAGERISRWVSPLSPLTPPNPPTIRSTRATTPHGRETGRATLRERPDCGTSVLGAYPSRGVGLAAGQQASFSDRAPRDSPPVPISL